MTALVDVLLSVDTCCLVDRTQSFSVFTLLKCKVLVTASVISVVCVWVLVCLSFMDVLFSLRSLFCVLQESNSSIRAQTSPGNGSELESFHGNFNLQLEDSDVFSDQDLDENQTEAEERKLLSKLQMEGSFNVDKSLSERKDGEGTQHNISSLHSSEQEQSDDDSLIVTQKKRAAVIYDSEEEDDDGQRLMKSQLEDSIQALGASTPKTASLSTPLGSRRSVGGNTSVASRRSFIHSISEDEEGDEELVPDSGKDYFLTVFAVSFFHELLG